MGYKCPQPDSDYNPDYVPLPPRKKRALSLPPSSPPLDDDFDVYSSTHPVQASTPEDDIQSRERLPALSTFPTPNPVASASGQPSTPRHWHAPRADSLEPLGSSPMSLVDVTPLKPRRKKGRPALTPETRRLKQTVRKLGSSEQSPDKWAVSTAAAELEKKGG
jgi:hypothetical protein